MAYAIGQTIAGSDRYSLTPILLVASVVPLVGMAAMLILVRNTRESREGVVNEI